MSRDGFTPNLRSARALLGLPGLRADLRRRAERVAAQARATAPVATGELRDSIRVEADVTPEGRPVARVRANTKYAARVYAQNGSLAAALDAARGS